tara:strand:- start:1378 stop:1569 length:192 start_codon:yes stop_codon:yes gene_type:complete
MDLSTYYDNSLRAETFKRDGSFGTKFYDKEGDMILEELYPGHSEAYAESAAENYVLGVKTIGI